MTREEAIKFAEYAQIMADGKPDVQEFYKLAESALRAQQELESKLRVLESSDMFDEDGGEILNDETVTDRHQLNEPLTLDELVEFGVRSENGENIIVYCTPLNDWAKVFKFGLLFFGTNDYRSWHEIEADYGKTWLAYRQKQEV